MLERRHALDLLRGLAALGVAIYHYLAWSQGITIQSLGTFGVYTFFILSGLTMMFVYGGTFADAISLEDAKRFYWNRVTRLLPLLVAVAIISFASHARGSFGSIVSAAIHAVLTGSGLFALHLPGYLSNAVGAWSLGIEVLFYALFPLVCLGARAAQKRTLLVIVVTLLGTQQAVLLLLRGLAISNFDAFWVYYTTPIVFAPFFGLGLLIFRFQMPETLGVWTLSCSVALLVLIAAFSTLVRTNIFTDNITYLFLTAVAGAAVFCAYAAVLPAWLVGTATFLGRISYALYLTHWITYGLFAKLSPSLLPTQIGGVLFLLASILVAYLVYTFFEMPTQRVLRRAIS